ncbi:MAG: sigma-70 family RNA polymerase sigma factor [Deltaproteobacteria bacterium]|nr:sigma-70 family RNA polymerase sigma factor [Deltaproteobacteria bacterium]
METTPQLPTGPTDLLLRWNHGDNKALQRLIPQVYSELRRVASRVMARERRDHTLDATGLVHEAFLRLHAAQAPACHDRGHFIALAGRMMRQVLVDHDRRVSAQRRGGGLRRVTLDDGAEAFGSRPEDTLALNNCLKRLEALAPRKARVIELRYFLGLSVSETAAALDLSARTIALDVRFARAWIAAELRGRPRDGA